MKRIALMSIVLAGALLVPTAGFAQISCTREGLQRAVDLYIAAQTTGDTSGMPMAVGLGYMENAAPADIGKGLIKTPMKIDHQRSLLDTATCQTFTEAIVANKEKPYVLGTRLRVNHDKIAEIETLWTTTGYWLFNADTYLQYSSTEKWDVIAVDKRDTRDHAGRGRQRLPRCVSRRENGFGPVGRAVQSHGRRRPHRQRCRRRLLPGRRPERREHRQPPLRGGRDDRCGGRVLHLRRRQRHRRQRRARYSPVPRGERQAALRAHVDASSAGEFPGRTRWPGVAPADRARPAVVRRARRRRTRRRSPARNTRSMRTGPDFQRERRGTETRRGLPRTGKDRSWCWCERRRTFACSPVMAPW